VIVSPKDCSRCHPAEAAQYARSKHANTLELIWKIDPWLNDGMNNSIERQTGCYHCHGSVVKVEGGKFNTDTWPNVGVGRINPDGSRGSCSSCHTRHKFSLSEARKPEACGQCHLGPDHPQIEIFEESKHGAIYHAEGDSWNWDAAPGAWTPGVDYRGRMDARRRLPDAELFGLSHVRREQDCRHTRRYRAARVGNAGAAYGSAEPVQALAGKN